MAETRFSRVLTVDKCSDVPDWSRLGIFSCHPCDLWRRKKAIKCCSATKQKRCLLSSKHHCTRKASGNCISIRIVCRDKVNNNNAAVVATSVHQSICSDNLQLQAQVSPEAAIALPEVRYSRHSSNLELKKLQLPSPVSNVSATDRKEVQFSRVLTVNECSDLPNWSRLGIFSCHPCDVWRVKKAHSAAKINRCHLSFRHQCTRKASGNGISIRIVCGGERNNSNAAAVTPVPQSEVPLLPESGNVSSKVRYLKRSFNLESKKLQSQMQAEEAKHLAVVRAKKERAIAFQVELSMKKQQVQEFNLMKMSQQVVKHEHELDVAKNTVLKMRKKLKESQSLTNYYKAKFLGQKGKVSNVQDVTATLEFFLSKLFPGKHPSTKAKLLIDEILKGQLYNGEAKNVMMDYVHSYIKDLFKPWRILKAGDVSAIGAFKTSTIKALNDVIDCDKLGLFPSPSAVDRARAKLDDYAFKMIGYERRDTIYGEVFFLNFENTLRLLLKSCQLHDLATRDHVKISLAIDGADIFKDRTHVSAGIKITDPRGVHPITKQPLFVPASDNDEEKIVRIQSSELCCILIIADARDKKELYEDIFREFYEWGARIGALGVPASNSEPALLPFAVTHTTDLKASWYLSNRGGGCKNKNYFCTFCPCRRQSLISYKINNDRCSRCKSRQKMKCYHHMVCDSISIPILLQCLQDELGTYFEQHRKTFDVIRNKSKLRTNFLQVDKDTDILHVEYVIPYNNEDKVREYTQFISQECRLRSIPLHGRLEDWRMSLLQSVQMERSIEYLERVKQWHDQGKESAPLVEVIEVLIPCILHCENRVGEKILTIILRRQLHQFHGPKLDFVMATERVLQTAVLGTGPSPSHWKLKHSKNPDGQIILEPIQVRNQVVRKMIQKIDIIADTTIPDSDHHFKTKFLLAVQAYKEGISLLTMHRNLTEDEQEIFQDKMDSFYENWIEIFGEEGITNYIHILGSGHMLYFLQKYNCLYMYSQQGWEDLNNRCQAFLLQNSSRGGYGSGEGKGKSYTYPFVRYVLRDLLWKTGDADNFFSTL